MTHASTIEALLFASGEPMEKKHLASLLGIKETELAGELEKLAGELAGRGIMLVESKNEVELRTAPEAAEIVKKLRESELSRDLGKAGLETLAVIAYREGATRSEVDWVRGVNSSTSMRSLLLRGLIEGREDEHDRRRIRYTLTTEALAHVGAATTRALPRFDELSSQAAQTADTHGNI